MEKEIQETIEKIHSLTGKEFAVYIDSLLSKNNPEIMKNKDVLMAIAEKLNGFGYQYHMIKNKFSDLGLNMTDELTKQDREKTMAFLEENSELLNTLEVASKWWIGAIKEPYFANYDNKQISLDMAMYFQLDYSEKKVRSDNNKHLTPDKEEKFKQALIYEMASEIRKNGFCELKADNYAFDILAKALQEANLRVAFPKKINMQVTTDQIKLVSSRGVWDVVYEASNKEDNSSKKM